MPWFISISRLLGETYIDSTSLGSFLSLSTTLAISDSIVEAIGYTQSLLDHRNRAISNNDLSGHWNRLHVFPLNRYDR